MRRSMTSGWDSTDAPFLEDLLPEEEAKLVTLLPEHLGEDGVSAVEDGDAALALLADLREHLVPVWPAGICAGFQASDKITLLL